MTEAVLVGPDRAPGVAATSRLRERNGSYAAVAARRDLDAALLGRTRALGVAIREHTALRALARDDRGIEATLEHDGTSETLRARFVVAADGHYSAVRRLLDRGHAPDLGSWHAARQYFRDVDDTRLWVLFERDLLPGYAWVFPLPERARERRLRGAARLRV